jgi:hypothetical protein
MKEEQETTPDKPTEPWKFYRDLTPAEEQIIEQHLLEHPGLTRERVLREMEAAGF